MAYIWILGSARESQRKKKEMIFNFYLFIEMMNLYLVNEKKKKKNLLCANYNVKSKQTQQCMQVIWGKNDNESESQFH